MLNHKIRTLIIPLPKHFVFWPLFSGKSVEMHTALSVNQYMAHTNDVNSTAVSFCSVKCSGPVKSLLLKKSIKKGPNRSKLCLLNC